MRVWIVLLVLAVCACGKETPKRKAPKAGAGAAKQPTADKPAAAKTAAPEPARFVAKLGADAGVTSVAMSADGRVLVTGGDRAAHVWDVVAGRKIHDLTARRGPTASVALSADGSVLLTGSTDGAAHVWDGNTGEPKREVKVKMRAVTAVALSPDGSRAIIAGEHAVAVADLASGKSPNSIKFRGTATSVALLGADRFAVGSSDHRVLVYEIGRGKRPVVFLGHTGAVTSIAASADGQLVLSGSRDNTARLWKAGDRTELRRFVGHGGAVTCVALSPDGRLVLTGSDDGTVRLWDDAGRELRRFVGHDGGVSSLAFGPSGVVLTGGRDGTTRLWTAEGQELCRLVSAPQGEWAVIDSSGRYDGSNGGDVDGIFWEAGGASISLGQLKDRYYEPSLLAKSIGFDREPVRDVPPLTSADPPPKVEAKAQGTKVDVEVTDRGGGVGRVEVKINGKEARFDASADLAKSEGLDLAGDPRLRDGETNDVEVTAYNARGDIGSTGGLFTVVAPGEPDTSPIKLWAVVVGVSEYAGENIRLLYAAKDAHDFANAIRLAAGYEPVSIKDVGKNKAPEKAVKEPMFAELKIVELTDAAATRDAIKSALEKLKGATANDVVVVYMAGHGVTYGEEYYYLTQEAKSGDVAEAGVRETAALSGDTITNLVNQSAVKHQVMILDTCAAGQILFNAQRKAPTSARKRALERLKDRTGFFVLAGSASDRVSYEASVFKQGLLTYALLSGMKGVALLDSGLENAPEPSPVRDQPLAVPTQPQPREVDVLKLFRFAIEEVPRLATRIKTADVQRPQLSMPKAGNSFPIGLLGAAELDKIKLESERAVFGQCVFVDADELGDPLDLVGRVEFGLNGDDMFVFVNVRHIPAAYWVSGSYALDKNDASLVDVAFRLHGPAPLGDGSAPMTITGPRNDADALAKKIVERIAERFKTAGRGVDPPKPAAPLMEVTDSPDPVGVGKEVTYQISVLNTGGQPARNIAITCDYESVAEFVSAGGATDGTANSKTVRFEVLSELAPNATATWRVVFKAKKPGDTMLTVRLNWTGATQRVKETESSRFGG